MRAERMLLLAICRPIAMRRGRLCGASRVRRACTWVRYRTDGGGPRTHRGL